MSSLRRRLGFGGDSSTDASREPTPDPIKPELLRVVTAEKLHKLKKDRNSKRRNVWIFGLGGLFGIAVAAFFAGSNDMIDLSSLTDMNMDSILEALPAGLVRDAQQRQVSKFSSSISSWTPEVC
jgi:phospholipid:diacylglycerol acyltransferase